MDIFNAILNALGLLLWSLWLVRRKGASGAAGPPRWIWLAGLLVLLTARSFFYWEIGSPLGWIFHLNLAVVSIPFSTEFLSRMLLYSPLSFVKSVFVFHVVLAAASVWARPVPTGGAAGWMFQRLSFSAQGWPGWVLWPAGCLSGLLMWVAASFLLQSSGLIPAVPLSDRLIEAALIGGAVLHLWLWALVGLIFVAVVNRYLYFGAHPLWVWVGTASTNSLRWVAWIPVRFRVFDLRPLAGAGLAAGISFLLQRLLEWR